MPRESAGLRILAVEDSVTARKVFQDLLVRLGVTTQNLRLASDGREALKLASDWAPDVIFLDMELRAFDPVRGVMGPRPGPSDPPPMNGDEVGREILRRDPRTKVVVVTALDRDHPRVKALLAGGAVDVIVKPVRASRVHEVLRRFGFPSSVAPGRP